MSVNLVDKTIHRILPLKIDENEVKVLDDVRFICMYDCGFSLDSYYLVICDYCHIYVFEAMTGKLQCILKDHTCDVCGISFSPDGEKFATCSYDSSIIIYSIRDFSILCKLINNSEVFGTCFSPCSKYIYSGDNTGSLKKWDINEGSVVKECHLHSGWIWRLKLSYDSKLLLTASDDNTVKLVDTDNFIVVRTFCHDSIIRAIEFHPTKRIVAVGDESKKVKLWNMDDGSLLHTFEMGGEVFSLHFLTSNILLIMSGDGYITSYDADSYEEIQKVHCDCESSYFSCAISPDKTQLSCGKCLNGINKIYSIVPKYDPSHQSMLIELSKDLGGYILSSLVSMCLDLQIIRQLVAAGINMNEEEYNMAINTCWDLIDINEANGGNMHEFRDEIPTDSDNDIDEH
eukprot:TRINITY_DN3030_c4_g18_i1.p1 TRINITY_DN3030_c4_g18~~TRINITY_DN3030_c4_g18_i1.p1  ORF type:complete len:401 (-),score=77.89 TRINITY_DN3030_c4_g18_i1:203-1405(-)